MPLLLGNKRRSEMNLVNTKKARINDDDKSADFKQDLVNISRLK